ncbi:MAG TPA: hypothetical protein DCP36_03650 [Sporomusaceae bacterium]|uniref:nucleoside recognition domain-containing protein n=1 Tax=Anaerospora sp. TaxID=1960278 RepID=UPI000EC8DA18|nr:nucleoside recognition domain-containing protein [Anaerospora sp.]HAK72898.1 hypothetical protein [Sporomusaceae bacterium]
MLLAEILFQGLMTSLVTVTKLALIILPLMVIVELAGYYGWLESISKKTKWFTDLFYLPSSAALPAFVGLFIGIVSGSGVILQFAKDNDYSRATVTILFVMVGICHSLFEETALFIGTGVNIFFVAAIRLLAALIFAFLIGRLIGRSQSSVTASR